MSVKETTKMIIEKKDDIFYRSPRGNSIRAGCWWNYNETCIVSYVDNGVIKMLICIFYLMNIIILCWSGDPERHEGDQRRRQDSSSLVHLLYGEGKRTTRWRWRVSFSTSWHVDWWVSSEQIYQKHQNTKSVITLLPLSPTPLPPPTPLQFKDQVVREAVEKICREFSGQCCIHKPLGAGGAGGGGGRGEAVEGTEAQQIPEVSSSTLPGAPSSSTPPCSSCRGQTTGGGYQCRYALTNKSLCY